VYERPTRSIRCVVCPTDSDATVEEATFDVGVAGGSARREYERRKGSRETRAKDKFGRRLGGVVLALTDDPQSTRAWATGARGEEKFAASLNGIDGLRVLHDRGALNSRANIDHIVIAPAGVFVVDAKNYRGTIAIRNRGWFFRPDHRLYVGRRDCSALATGLGWQVEAVTVALAAAGVDPLPPVTPVLCFIDGEWPLFSAPDEYAGVRLEGTGSIRKLVATPAVLDPPSIDSITRLLAVALPAK
jgi:nuclease-like protein